MSQPIRILYFCNEPVRGGAEEHILTLLRGLDRDIFAPHLVCRSELLEQIRSDLPPDVAVHTLKLFHPWEVNAARALAAILCQQRIGIFHSHLFRASLVGSPVARLCRVPVIVETTHLRESWRKPWTYIIDRSVSSIVDYFIAVSHANAKYLAEEKGIDRAKIVVIHNGADLKRFQLSEQTGSELRRSLCGSSGGPIMVVPARLEEQKGHAILLNAMEEIRREFPSIRLIVIGTGSLKAKLAEQVKLLGLGDCVSFVGFQANMPEWLAVADLVVLPSFFEGLPIIAIETLASGKAMLATAVDGTPEIVVNGKTGVTVRPGDPHALASAACQLLRNPQERSELGRRGREWVLKHFSEEVQVQKTMQLYLRAYTARTGKSVGSMSGIGANQPTDTLHVTSAAIG